MKEKHPDFSRRKFLTGIGALTVTSMIPINQACSHSSNNTSKQNPEGSIKVPTRKLGKTGVEVPVLVIGAGGDMGKKHPFMTTCLKYGVRYWDTSVLYADGLAETGIGEYFVKNPGSREEVYIVTKADDIWDNMPDLKRIEKNMELSLKRLGIQQLDGYIPLHATEKPEQISKEIGEWVVQQKRRGKFRFAGVSTHNNMAPILMKAAETDWVDFVYTKYNFELFNDEEMQKALDACYNAGKGIIAIKTQRTLSKELKLTEPFEIETLEKMVNHFREQGYTEGQAKLKLVLDDKRLTGASVGMDDTGILMQNVAATLDQIRLSQADIDMLNDYAKATSHLSCLGCTEICKKAMPQMPYIADVLRFMVYQNSYCNHHLAKQNYIRLPENIKINIKNFDYSNAEAMCPQKIAIGNLIREAADLMS